MTPEEERQNQALLDAYQKGAEPEPVNLAFNPGGQMDTFAKQASEDLAYEPHASEPAQTAITPVTPPPAPPELSARPEYKEEPLGARIIKAIARSAPGIVDAYGARKAAGALQGSGAGPQGFLTSMSNRGRASVELGAQEGANERSVLRREQRQDWQDKNSAATQGYGLRREAWADKTQAEELAAKRGRAGVEDQFSAEARDANSTKSRNLRSEIRTAFPDFADSMGQDFEHMSLYDFAHSPHPGLDKAKFDAMTQRQKDMLSTRGTQAIDLEGVRNEGRIKLKSTPAAPKLGAGKGGSGGGVDTSEYEQALAKEFGGADKVPPTLLAQLHAAARAKNPNAAIKSVMQNAHGQKTGGEKQANAETVAYEKQAGPAAELIAHTRALRQILTESGIDPDHYKGEDIPGEGRFKSMLPDGAVSAQGQRVRAALTSVVLDMQQSMTHIRTSDQEAARVAKAFGAMKGGSQENVIWGLHQLEAFAKKKAARAESERAPGARGGKVRIKLEDGIHSYSGTADEARKAGYTVVE